MIHDFIHDFSVQRQSTMPLPHGLGELPSGRQTAHSTNYSPIDPNISAYPYTVEELTYPAFRSLDEAIKNFWSGIRVPTKDSYRYMRVKISGGDKSLLIWADELKEKRVILPVAAISRDDHELNTNRYNPPYIPMATRYLNSEGTLAARIFKPIPYKVSYQLIIWGEHKRDVEYILQQSLIRFNPIAEFRMSDGKLTGNVQLHLTSCRDASDKEAGYDQQANVRYEIGLLAEAWLALPEKVVPTVRGHVVALQDNFGRYLEVLPGLYSHWTVPTVE